MAVVRAEFTVLARLMAASRYERTELVRQGRDGAQVDSVALRDLVASRLGNPRIDAWAVRPAQSI